MKRRLYFLLPDLEHARAVVQELETHGIAREQIHVIAGHGVDPGDLPPASLQQQRDTGARLENILWRGNLAIFFIALLLLIVMALLKTAWPWLLLPAAVMLLSFMAGFGFTTRVPNVHLDEFRDAMQHAEILLMVDVPVTQVARVERLVHRQHPEAAACGVGWSIAHLSI